MLYDTIVLKDSTFYKNAKSPLHRPPRFPSGHQTLHVRNLLISHLDKHASSEPSWQDLLPQCHNIQDFTIWSGATPLALSNLSSAIRSPLRTVHPCGLLRLSASLLNLFGGRADFNHEVFEHLTHLEVLDFPGESGDRWVEGNNYGCIPKLRYLSIAYFDCELSIGVRFVKKCLEECKALEVLILLENDIRVAEQVDEILKTSRRVVGPDGGIQEVPEDRVVNYRGHSIPGERWTEAWYRGAVCGDDFWVHSEKIIQRRRWKRELGMLMWDPTLDCSVDDDLGEWIIAMEKD
ncbi:hypothetical protein AX16_009230 [Volvariella volvacea WC 439]|nr:hypothetical protein AX16_009230 [Volvariella volvacea WC 439]